MEQKTTALSHTWAQMGARMVEFAGYQMPVQFADGVIKEHLWTRQNAGLFDVAHMGPCWFGLKDLTGSPEERHQRIAKIVEKILPCDVAGLKAGQIRYTVLLNENGGIIDDLMVARPPLEKDAGSLYIVVNAGGKEKDFEIFSYLSPSETNLTRLDEDALVALQGPLAKDAIALIAKDASELDFMNFGIFPTKWGEILISRSGYTGEDGFEILLPREYSVAIVETLLADERIKPIGLGARDSLRLEAGLCLYGHDLTQEISPIEAGLLWTIQKNRRENKDFLGATRISNEIENGASRKRVGILPLDKAPAREGVEIYSLAGEKIGEITSGGFSPSLGVPIAMGYVTKEFSAIDTEIDLMVRGTLRRAKIAKMPFTPHNYFKRI